MKRLITVLMVALMVAFGLVACDTLDSADDGTSAQNLQPNLAGYSRQDVDGIVDAFATTLGASALASGNVPMALTVERVNTGLGCLQEKGAISGQMYIQEATSLSVPQGGVSVVINVNRTQRNLFNCLTDQPFSAQSLEVQPCFVNGTLNYEGDEYIYMYAAAGDEICALFGQHFQTNLSGTITSQYP